VGQAFSSGQDRREEGELFGDRLGSKRLCDHYLLVKGCDSLSRGKGTIGGVEPMLNTVCRGKNRRQGLWQKRKEGAEADKEKRSSNQPLLNKKELGGIGLLKKLNLRGEEKIYGGSSA